MKSQLMLYNLSDDRMTALGVGDRCFQPFIYQDRIAYNEASAGRYGTIYVVDIGTGKKQVIWPDARYVPSDWMQRADRYGGSFPTINERYITWTTDFPCVVCYDLTTKNLVRLASEASIILLIRAAAGIEQPIIFHHRAFRKVCISLLGLVRK